MRVGLLRADRVFPGVFGGSAQTPAAPFVSAATTHASHKRMSDEEKPEAHGPERHDYWAAPSHRQ